jgi:hypothetical protein
MKYIVSSNIIILSIILIYIFKDKRTDNYVGIKKLSNLTFESEIGRENISKDSTCSTVIIWFNPECEHCRYQLDVINNHISRFPTIRFLFITDEKDFFVKKYHILWPDLVESSHTLFGIIDRTRFIEEFGSVITPSLLFFDQRGILKEKLLGEVKIEKIVQLINKHPVPEQKMSGLN